MREDGVVSGLTHLAESKNTACVFSGSYKYPRATICPRMTNSPGAPIGTRVSWSCGLTIQQQPPSGCPIFIGFVWRDSGTLAVAAIEHSEGPYPLANRTCGAQVLMFSSKTASPPSTRNFSVGTCLGCMDFTSDGVRKAQVILNCWMQKAGP